MSSALQINSMYYTLKEYAQLVIHVLEVIQKKYDDFVLKVSVC